MDNIYYENTTISYKTVNIFETMFTEKKHEIIKELRKNIKEKYNIDIITNGHESTNTTPVPNRTNPPPDNT